MKKLTVIILLLCTLILIEKKSYAGTITLQGTIGKIPIVMELNIDPVSASGTYFYKKLKQDIAFEGTAASNNLSLKSESTGDKFELTRNGHTLNGTYTNKKGTKLPVRLNDVEPNSVKLLFVNETLSKTLSDYSKLRLNEIKLIPGKQELLNQKYLIQWYSEPNSKINVFKIISGYPQPIINTINDQLYNEYYQNFEAYFSCSDMDGNAGYEQIEITSCFLNEQFVSICISSGWYCHPAAHPDFGESGITFNTKTGKKLELEDILWFGTGAKPKKESDEWFSYRSKTYAPQIVKLFKRLYPTEMIKPQTEENCDYTDSEVWDFGSWYFTQKGLYVGAYFARVARSCDNPGWSIIPFSELKKMKQANHTLTF
ncbi:hypothetical protein NF867_04655 [Solitalea sp. MAHUQ-68]|uniref:Uncharacterized protein n=1 Tax=Solitalea agri TaxID=2953739 RepID=A0A9X2JE98_9SPHI|nr:hypothetical protein [Solitalea agri]MCO4292151.1 hypothetical protein [Solitalea agri]